MSFQDFALDPEKHKLRFYGPGQYFAAETPMQCADHDAQKRTVIVLPGTLLNHEMNPKVYYDYSQAMVGLVQASLARKGIDANVSCAVYGHNDEQSICDHFGRRVRLDHPTPKVGEPSPDPAGTDMHDFVDDVLLPFAGISGDAHPSADEACEKLSKLTLVSNSYGTGFAQEAGYLLNQKLIARGYSQADAERITGEIVELGCGNMADLTRDEPGIRSITLTAERDGTSWETAGRIADNLILHGLSETDRHALQREIYSRCGFDPALMDGSAIHVPAHKTELESPTEVQAGRGRQIRFTAPAEIRMYSSTKEGQSRVVLDQPKIDRLMHNIREGMAAFGLNPNGLNGEPLVSGNLVVAHDTRMFMAPDTRGEPVHPDTENKALTEKFDDMLSASVQREVQLQNVTLVGGSQLDLIAEGYTPPQIPSLHVNTIDRTNMIGPQLPIPGSWVPGSS